MEASERPQLPIDDGAAADGSVRAIDDRLVIERLEVADARAARLVRERAEGGQSPAQAVRDAVEIGARVLEREGTAAEVDYVRAEFERVAGEARRQMLEQAGGVTKEIERQFERAFADEGGALPRAFDGFERDLAEQIAAHFGADRSTAVQHQIRDQVSKLVEERLAALIRHFASDDAANPFADAKRAISQAVAESTRRQESRVQSLAETLQRVERNVVKLAAEAEAQAQLAEAERAGTRKGRTFEDRVHAAVERIAEARGDCAHHVGDERGEGGSKKGDTVVEIGAADGKCLGRIVFEDKDDQLSRNEAWRELNAAMSERDADFAVLVVAGEDNIPAKREQLVEYEGNKLIVAVDPELPDEIGLDLAYRYARLRVLIARDRALEVDAGGVRDAAEAARSALKRAQSVRLALTNVDKSSAKAREGIEGIVADVEVELARIEALIADADVSGQDV